MQTLFDVPQRKGHPAKYTDVLLSTFVGMLRGSRRVLDPFGGTGKIFLVEHWLPQLQIEAIEIEREWGEQHPRTTIGNALHLPWDDGHFDAICTSPTYGNRMADQLIDGYERMTYTAKLDRPLHPDNTGKLQWGPKYRAVHVQAWKEAKRVLQPGGKFILNMKDHIRNGRRQRVTDWHISALENLGFRQVRHEKLPVPGMGYGQNGDKRIPYESVILFTLEQENN